MGTLIFNIAAGRVAEFYDRVKSNDPGTSALILIPIEAAGRVADATMIDYDTVAAVLAGATNEQTTMGRKTLTDAELAAIPAPDDGNNWNERSLPTVTWAAAGGNAVGDILVAYDSNTGAGDDTNLVPLTIFTFAVTPSGADIQMTGGTFFRAKDINLGA